ncbi:MAG: hypothetical protein RL333_1439 [Pseudomonadota bacterium]
MIRWPTLGFGIQHRTLATRLVFWFSVLLLVPMLIISVAIDRVSNRALQEDVLEKLGMVARDKASSLEILAYDRTRSAAMIGRIGRIGTAATLLANPKTAEKDRIEQVEVMGRLTSLYASHLGFLDVIVVCPKGNVLYQSSNRFDLGSSLVNGPLRDSPLGELVKRSLTLLEPDISDFDIYPGSELPQGFVSAPIIQEDGTKAGLVILQINDKEILDILTNYTGLGRTGNVIVGALKGEVIHVVAPIRGRPDAAFKVNVGVGAPYGSDIQNAVIGNLGGGRVRSVLKTDVLASWIYVPSFRWGIAIEQNFSEATDMVGDQRMALFGAVAAIITPILLIALMVARSISGPIRTAVQAAERVAAGDLSGDLSAYGNDETSKLLNALGKMVNDLNSLISQVQRSTIDLVSTANSLSAMTRTQSDEVKNLGSTTTEIAAATKQISATSEELLQRMTRISTATDHTQELANSGQTAIGTMETTMRSLSDATHSISDRLAQISQKTNIIGTVTTTITKIADQTNLLSLNASIEAEKAGEYGVGFAVLAREIRRLADQTAVATLDIERMIREMQDSVTGGVVEMDKFSEQVNRSVSDTHLIGERFGTIIQLVQDLLPQFEAVHEGMRSQSAGAREIRDSMVSLTESVRVSAQSLDETRAATHRLEAAIDELRSEISAFRLG